MAAAEQNLIGTTHASLGAYLLGLWGLPGHMVETAAFHHTPGVKASNAPTPLIINHIADAFANAGEKLSDPDHVLEGLDEAAIQQAGLLAHIPSWRKICASFLNDT
jgi:HD-like signal output (HDOD) protein